MREFSDKAQDYRDLFEGWQEYHEMVSERPKYADVYASTMDAAVERMAALEPEVEAELLAAAGYESPEITQQREAIENQRDTKLFSLGLISEQKIRRQLAKLPKQEEFSPEDKLFGQAYVVGKFLASTDGKLGLLAAAGPLSDEEKEALEIANETPEQSLQRKVESLRRGQILPAPEYLYITLLRIDNLSDIAKQYVDMFCEGDKCQRLLEFFAKANERAEELATLYPDIQNMINTLPPEEINEGVMKTLTTLAASDEWFEAILEISDELDKPTDDIYTALLMMSQEELKILNDVLHSHRWTKVVQQRTGGWNSGYIEMGVSKVRVGDKEFVLGQPEDSVSQAVPFNIEEEATVFPAPAEPISQPAVEVTPAPEPVIEVPEAAEAVVEEPEAVPSPVPTNSRSQRRANRPLRADRSEETQQRQAEAAKKFAEWEVSTRKAIGEAISALEADGLLSESEISARIASKKSSSTIIGTKTAIERLGKTGLLKPDRSSPQDTPLTAYHLVAMTLLNTHRNDLEKKSPRLKRAEELIRECVDSYFARQRKSQE